MSRCASTCDLFKKRYWTLVKFQIGIQSLVEYIYGSLMEYFAMAFRWFLYALLKYFKEDFFMEKIKEYESMKLLTEPEKMFNLIGLQGDVSMLPVVTFVGESKAAKSTLVAKLAYEPYQSSMMKLTGKKGSTTPGPAEIIIDPDCSSANICMSLKTKEEIRDDLVINFKNTLHKAVRSLLSSMPNDSVKIPKFIDKTTQDRIEDEDRKFRVSKLLIDESKESYFQLMRRIIELLNLEADSKFREVYFTTKKDSEKEASIQISILVDQVLAIVGGYSDPENDTTSNVSNTDATLIEQMVNVLYEQGISTLLEWGFINSNEYGPDYWAKWNITNDDFDNAIMHITNSKDHDVQSVACLINRLVIKVPGRGLITKMDFNTAYIISDVVGVSNDGLDEISELTRKAMLETLKYDVVVYVGKITTPEAMHSSYIELLFDTIRPAQLVVALTFLDKDDLFDTDDDIEESDIYDMIHSHKNEILDIIKRIGHTDAPVIMPTADEIVCLANVVPRKLGEAAVNIFKSEHPYNCLRDAFERGYNRVRTRVHIDDINRDTNFMKPSLDNVAESKVVERIIEAVENELNDLRARSNRIHHWTVDAILWHMLRGNEHISNAEVWDNVVIRVYSNIRKEMYKSYGSIKFADAYGFNDKEAERIRLEFIANLTTELSRASVNLILLSADGTGEKSKCHDTIRHLARMPKYNKWRIFEDLRNALIESADNENYVNRLLDVAFKNAMRATYDRTMI